MSELQKPVWFHQWYGTSYLFTHYILFEKSYETVERLNSVLEMADSYDVALEML